MIKDLGLHLHNSRLGLKDDPDPEDLEARKRLYLSAYSWDKSISLCLGRPPSLTELPYAPNSILDKSGDSDTWIPFYLGESNIDYPPTDSLTTLTFINFCELSRVRRIRIHPTVTNTNRSSVAAMLLSTPARLKASEYSLSLP